MNPRLTRKRRHNRPSKPLRGKVPASDDDGTASKDSHPSTSEPPSEAICYDSDYSGPPPSAHGRCSGLHFSLTRRKKINYISPTTDEGYDAPRSTYNGTSSTNDGPIIPSSLPLSTLGVKYSLRSSIGDGRLQPSGPTIMSRRNLHPNGSHLLTSHWSTDGSRPYMEDRYAVEQLGSIITPSGSLPLTYLAIFDGHGGPHASQFCCDRLSTYIRHQNEFPKDLPMAMRRAFRAIDDDFVRSAYSSGSTALGCIVVGGERVICANAGDSRAVLVRKGGCVRLSRDHKPGVPDETRRITELGGKVVYFGRWRVESVLAVSRSVGDSALKPYVTAEPDVGEWTLGDDDLYLVIASDGIWDALQDEQVGDFVRKKAMEKEGMKRVARHLCDWADKCGSRDNKCAVIVDLKSFRERDD